jgi:hypothetical protein
MNNKRKNNNKIKFLKKWQIWMWRQTHTQRKPCEDTGRMSCEDGTTETHLQAKECQRIPEARRQACCSCFPGDFPLCTALRTPEF